MPKDETSEEFRKLWHDLFESTVRNEHGQLLDGNKLEVEQRYKALSVTEQVLIDDQILERFKLEPDKSRGVSSHYWLRALKASKDPHLIEKLRAAVPTVHPHLVTGFMSTVLPFIARRTGKVEGWSWYEMTVESRLASFTGAYLWMFEHIDLSFDDMSDRFLSRFVKGWLRPGAGQTFFRDSMQPFMTKLLWKARIGYLASGCTSSGYIYRPTSEHGALYSDTLHAYIRVRDLIWTLSVWGRKPAMDLIGPLPLPTFPEMEPPPQPTPTQQKEILAARDAFIKSNASRETLDHLLGLADKQFDLAIGVAVQRAYEDALREMFPEYIPPRMALPYATDRELVAGAYYGAFPDRSPPNPKPRPVQNYTWPPASDPVTPTGKNADLLWQIELVRRHRDARNRT